MGYQPVAVQTFQRVLRRELQWNSHALKSAGVA